MQRLHLHDGDCEPRTPISSQGPTMSERIAMLQDIVGAALPSKTERELICSWVPPFAYYLGIGVPLVRWRTLPGAWAFEWRWWYGQGEVSGDEGVMICNRDEMTCNRGEKALVLFCYDFRGGQLLILLCWEDIGQRSCSTEERWRILLRQGRMGHWTRISLCCRRKT